MLKLTYEIICYELRKAVNVRVSGFNKDCGLIELPMLYEQGMTVTSGFCYVSEATPRSQNSFGEKALFIVCGKIPDSFPEEPGISILYFSEPQTRAVVFNILQGVFLKYRLWENSLANQIKESVCLNTLLKLSLPIFDNPLFLIDSRYFLIAVAQPELDPGMETQKVDDIWLARGKEDLIRAEMVNAPYSRHLPKDHPRLFINISENGYLLGILSIEASHSELREFDGYLLTHLAEIMRTAMLRSGITNSNRRNHLETLLSEMIKGNTIDLEEFSKIVSSYGITRNDQFRCLAIRIPEPSGRIFIRNLLLQLGTQIPAMYIPTGGEAGAMVLSSTRAERQGIDIVPLLSKKLKPFRFKVGLSDLYNDLLLTKSYFSQALYALEKIEAEPGDKLVSVFEEHLLDYILENCSGSLEPSTLWGKGFKNLLDHDIHSKISYVETLSSYLKNNLNTSKAAAALYVSRNAFLSRLKRINKLLGEDFTDPKIRFTYELFLLLYEMKCQDILSP